MLVVDASAIVDLLLALPPAEKVGEHIGSHDHVLAAPHILDLEVLHALRRLVSVGEATPARADDAVSDLLNLSFERYEHHGLLSRIWHLRKNFSPYDAAYLALAENLTDDGVPLLTTDARLARAAQKHSRVEVLLAA